MLFVWKHVAVKRFISKYFYLQNVLFVCNPLLVTNILFVIFYVRLVLLANNCLDMTTFS